MPYSPAKPLPRSATLAWVATVHIFGIFFFSFFLFFFRPRGGGRVGTLKVRTLKGMLSYAGSFAALERLPAIRIRRIAIASFPKYIAYSRHQFRVRCRYWPDYSPGAAGRYGHDLIPWILTTFREEQVWAKSMRFLLISERLL